MIYGALPEGLGLIDISPVEMMCWLYCPIATPTEGMQIPANLRQFAPIVLASCAREGIRYFDRYVYLTAKTLWVSGDYIGNRPGWHSDGFGTDDVNYVWYDRAPTEFIEASMAVPRTYPDKHLLRLTPAVIHRSPVGFAAGMRTFVKVSISSERYNLEGNSVNHLLEERWPLLPRFPERNHPARDYEPMHLAPAQPQRSKAAPVDG
jgi:hypothetical protein